MNAQAQTSPDAQAAQRANERAIRDAQERPLPRVDVFTAPSQPSPEAVPVTPSGKSEPCARVDSLELIGHLPAMGPLPELPVAPSCLHAAAINRLLATLNAHYQAAGWITTRVYVDRDTVPTHHLRLRVVPGRIERIVLGQSNDDARAQAAFPQREDRLLNLRDLEQGLENINRLPSQEGKFNLIPGAENGHSQVQVDLKERARTRLTQMVDNSGTQAMGKWKSTTEIAIDNPTQHNDQLAIGLLGNLDGGDLDARFRGVTLNYLIPDGYHLWSVAGSAIRTTFELPGINTSYPMHTRADKLGLGYEYLFSRDQQSKHSLTAGLDVTRQHSEIAGIDIPSQERRLTVAHIGYRGKVYLGTQSHEWALRYEQGLTAFNAQTSITDGSNPQYRLLKLRLTSQWPMPDNQGLIRTLLQAQTGPSDAPTLAQIYVGGRYDVRGYQQNSLYAATGAFLRSEYETPSAQWVGTRWTAYMGLDAGRVRSLPNRPLSQQHLVGAAVGLRGEVQNLKFELAHARALSRPDEFGTEDWDRWYAQLSLVF
jgi:hemolysin activation/secretion protein